MKKKNGFKLSSLPCAVNTLECYASLSLSIVIEFFYQTLGVLSQDGLLRFIDIHACKQLFEIGGADEVLYPYDKVLICSLFYLFLSYFFFLDLACFSFTVLMLALYLFRPMSVNFCLLFILPITNCVMFPINFLIALFPSKLRRFYTYMQTLMHVDYPPPPQPPFPKCLWFHFLLGWQ